MYSMKTGQPSIYLIMIHNALALQSVAAPCAAGTATAHLHLALDASRASGRSARIALGASRASGRSARICRQYT